MKKFVAVLSVMLFCLGMYAFWQFIRFNDGKLHVIFCDVGQGDAILIKTPDNKFILYDGGPDRKVLQCLSEHMPFWKRDIDLMILSHPHADHFYGMFYVLERYNLKSFATEDLVNKTTAFDTLLQQLERKNVLRQVVLAGDVWRIGNVELKVMGPTEKYLKQTSPGGTIGESKEFASIILQVTYGEFDVLLTGDSQASGLESAFEEIDGDIEVLQSPHHGSATGLESSLLDALDPEIGIISVGDNRYGHPNKKILDLFEASGIKTLRTDEKGDIEILSNTSKWYIK